MKLATESVQSGKVTGGGARPGGNMASKDQNLAEFVDAHSGCPEYLPCVHTTDGHTFRAILNQKQLTPTSCPVYGEELLYFFYGRPAYRVNSSISATTILANLPVCFILRHDVLGSGKRQYPFDTGAFESKAFVDFLHAQMNVTDFELTCHPLTPAKFVKAFFGDNKQYMLGMCRNDIIIDSLDFELDSFVKLASCGMNSKIDDRRSTLEIQIDTSIPIDTGLVRAIVLPDTFVNNPSVASYFEDNNVDAITYQPIRMKPIEYMGTLYESVMKYYESEGLLT